MKHNRTYVTLQEMLNEIKLIGKEIEISQTDRTISTHGHTNALSINTMTKTKKQIEIQPRDQIWSLLDFEAMKIFKQIDLCFIFSHKNLKFKAVFWTIKNLKWWNFCIRLNTLFIITLIWAFRSTRPILVYRVEKSKDCNRSGEVLSISDLKRFKFIYYLHHSCSHWESLRIQLLSQGTSAFLSLDTQRSLTVWNIALKKEHSHLETSVREVELAAQINLGLIGFLWNFQTAQRNRRQGPHLTPVKLWALLKERWNLRISDRARLETTYVPTGELSSDETEET